MRRSFIVQAITAVALIFAPPAAHAGLLEFVQPHLKTFPQCDDDKVLGEIIKRFNKAEDTFYHRGIYLDSVDGRRRDHLHRTRSICNPGSV